MRKWCQLPSKLGRILCQRLLAAVGSALYGCSVGAVSKTLATKLARSVLIGVWGLSLSGRCLEIAMTLLALDPEQAVPYRRLISLRRMLEMRSDLHE